MTRKEQHKARKRKNKGKYLYWSSGIVCSLMFIGRDAKRHTTFYVSKVEED
jgi:hypothetical protein